MDMLVALAERWNRDATILEDYGAHHEARAVRKCAAELAASIREWQLEALTLKEAELESGYSYSALQQMVAEGEVPNAGEKHKPRIRRIDLPKKSGCRSLELVESGSDLVDLVLG